MGAEVGLFVLALAAGVGLAWRGTISPAVLAVFSCGYVVGMLFLSPDLDLARSRPSKRWRGLTVLWWPYARLFRHRGISHHAVWGPLTRLVYLAALVAAIAGGVSALIGLRLRPVAWPGEAWAFVIGVYVPNVAHVALDAVGAARRRRTRPGRRG